MTREEGRIAFTPLCESNANSASCFLLEIDNCRILLDCGWTSPYDPVALIPLQSVASTVDFVLLSHSDPAHLGALPHALSRLGLTGKVLCTLPVSKMGQMFLYDTVLSLQEELEFSSFSLDEVDNAFSKLVTLKYNEEFIDEEHGLVITAVNAGHMVGGAAWMISKEIHNILYITDFNHKREKHLNGLRFESLKRPSILITDSKNISKTTIKDEDRNIAFLTSISQTLRGGGKVLIPTDAAGRVLELILILEEYWIKNKLNFPLVLLGNVAYSTVNFASCQLEWMHSSISSTFEKDRDNPFDFRCVRFCNNLEDLKKIKEGPLVVLASSASLETGFAKQLAIDWIQDEHNAILFTQPLNDDTFGHQLMHQKDQIFTTTIFRRVPLNESELAEFEAEKLRRLSESAKELETDLEANSEGLSMELSPSNLTRGLSIEEGAEIEIKHCMVSGALIDGFDPVEGASFPLFPNQAENERLWDVFGETFEESELLHLTSTTKEDQSLLLGAPILVDEEVPEIPTKIITEEQSFHIKGSVLCFDFSASTNGHFMQHFITYMQPRNLILINGTTESHRRYSEVVKGVLRNTGRVFCPIKEQRIEILDQLNCFGIVMEKELVQNLEWKNSGSTEVAWIEGELQISEEEPSMIKMIPCKAEIPRSGRTTGLFAGDCRLSSIKKKMESVGMKTMFQEGKLVCNGLIQIQVLQHYRIAIEGPLCTDYYLIRQAIDEMYKLN